MCFSIATINRELANVDVLMLNRRKCHDAYDPMQMQKCQKMLDSTTSITLLLLPSTPCLPSFVIALLSSPYTIQVYCHATAPFCAPVKASNPIHLLIFPPGTSLSFNPLMLAKTWYGPEKFAPVGQAMRPAEPGRLTLKVPKLVPGVNVKPV